MNKKQIIAMVMDIIAEVDYDIYKGFLPEFSEEPDHIEAKIEELVRIVNAHLKEVV